VVKKKCGLRMQQKRTATNKRRDEGEAGPTEGPMAEEDVWKGGIIRLREGGYGVGRKKIVKIYCEQKWGDRREQGCSLLT